MKQHGTAPESPHFGSVPRKERRYPEKQKGLGKGFTEPPNLQMLFVV
jgi:hypothetical protein